MALRLLIGVFSGSFISTSTYIINSGSGVLDALNYGRFLGVDVTAANSQLGAVLLNGEPAR